MLHSSETLRNPEAISPWSQCSQFMNFFWVGPSYCNQKLCADCLDTSVHRSCTCVIWTMLHSSETLRNLPGHFSSQFMHMFHLNYFILIRNSTQYLKDTFLWSQWLQFAHLFDMDHLILIRSLEQSQKHTLLDVIILSPDEMPCIPAHLYLSFPTFACVLW